MGAREDLRDAEAVARDERAQERGLATVVEPARIAQEYVRAVHPDTGLDVTFVPGEALPDWVPDALIALGREARDEFLRTVDGA